jgi:enamine deaminase RidA (YjgF/YER057c/UK114 family)
MSIAARLAELGIVLPPATAPAGVFVPFVQSGSLVFLSGHIAKRDGKPWVGRLGEAISTDEGRLAARAVAIDLLGTLQEAAGDLDRVRRIVKLFVLVNSAADFTAQPQVANGASELLAAVFGPKAAHARSAVGAAQLPYGTCVEIEMIAELD